MSAEEALRENEDLALRNNQIISHVTGGKKQFKRKSGAGALIAILATIGIFAVFFMTSNLLPAAISDRLIEETDVQYADAVESKMVIFAQAMRDGEIPDDTAEKLLRKGVEVGYVEEGNFIKDNKPGKSLSLKFDNDIISADDFLSRVNTDARLYDAFNAATYSRAAYYYDDAAEKVFKRIGTSRNNYNVITDFDEVTEALMGEGSNISINNVVKVEKTREENGETITYYEYETLGNSTLSTASNFIDLVAEKSLAEDTNNATMNAASALNTADKISREQRSELFFLAFMENISKMKAGEGNNAKVNEVMNRLYKTETSQVVDVTTGEIITTTGSMVESPSLYAILAGTPISVDKVTNYSSDRIVTLAKNALGLSETPNSSLSGTVTSTNTNVRGSIGRYITSNVTPAAKDTLEATSSIIDSSLIHNSYSTVVGISAGEFLVEGATNVGKALAKASGATVGSAEAVKSYARLTSNVLALDAEVDRMNRSPFDITSKNTFLGSIVYNLATTMQSGPLLTQFANIGRSFGAAISNLLPSTHANDETEHYLANFGNNCDTLNSIGAVGSATCNEIATFDSSTLDDIFNDAGFIQFMEENTFLNDSGTRVIKTDSKLADFINYNDNRITPVGVTDGGIIKSLKNDSDSIQFITDILSMVEDSLDITEEDKRLATGESFVNSSSNPEWDTTYKYAQRYVSLARAADSLRRYSDDDTSYSNLKYFEGTENPVIAFINSQNNIATK